VAFGLTATDLVCLGSGVVVGAWVHLHVHAVIQLRVALSLPPVALGSLLGLGRLGDLTARGLAVSLARYLLRPRRLVYRVRSW
jgi:hypothetical protein